MSLPAQKSKNDYNKYLNSYLATLNQSIQNNDLVYNAVSANLAGDMMAVPQMPQDTRSVEDKLRDIENLKVQLQSQLMSLTDGKTANEIVKELNDFEIQQAVQSFPSLYQTLKSVWSMGVPSVIFVQALRNLAQKQDLTAGIEMNLQQGNADTLQLSPQQLQGLIDAGDLDNLMGVAQGLPQRQQQGLLSQISYVKQLLFDKGDLPNRIERARQIEAASGIDQSIPVSVQQFLIPKDDFNVELNELNQAIADGNATDRDRTLKNIMDALNLPQDVIADLAEFDFNPSSTPSQQGEKRERVSRKLESRLSSLMGKEEEVPKGLSKPKQRTYPEVIRRGQTQPLEERQARQQTIRESVRGKNVKRGTYRPRKAEQGQAGAEEEKGQTQAEIDAQYYANQPAKYSLSAPVYSEKAPAGFNPNLSSMSGETRIEGYNPSDTSPSITTLPINGPKTSRARASMSQGEEDSPRSGDFLKNYEAFIEGLINPNAGTRERRTKLLSTVARKTGDMFNYRPSLTSQYEDITVSDMVEKQGILANLEGDPRKTKTFWKNNINTKDMYGKFKKITGRGLRGMSGRGVSFNISEEPQTKPKSIKLKIAGVIEKEPPYVPFGRYAINKHKLASDIFMLRTQKGGAIPRLLTQKLSNKLSKIIKTIADKGTPSFEEIGNLETLDKEILHKILQESQISSISTPNPSRDQDEKDHRRFLILKGELIAGNNNPALAKELKRLIIKLMSREILPRREAQNALVELAMLETI